MSGKLSRRTFLKGLSQGLLGVAAWGSFSKFGLPNAFAQSVSGKKLLIVNFGGGYDTLAVCQPNLGALADIRPTLFNDQSALSLPTTNLAFHSTMTAMRDQFVAGNVAICHKVGYINGSRSHEEAELAFARGVYDRTSTERRGWVNRLGFANFNSIFQVVDLTGGHNTTSQGQFLPTSVSQLSTFGFESDSTQNSLENEQRRLHVFDMMSDWKPGNMPDRLALDYGWTGVRDSVDQIRAVVSNASYPGGAYPNSSIGQKFRDADLAFSGLDSVVVYTKFGGFDTHDGQASRLNSLLGQFNAALNTFILNMQAKGIWNDVVILCVSEFARTNRENGNQGTDHGLANDLYLIGPSVRGGVYGPSYTASDFAASRNWLNPGLNMLDIYRPVVAHLGYNPNVVFEQAQTTNLQLFV